MKGKLRKRFLLGALLLGTPSVVCAYVVCTDVTNVYPNGVTTHCKICEIRSNADDSVQGEITNCPSDDPRGGPV